MLVLSTHVENGFQENIKYGDIFVDLSIVYDTMWKRGLPLKNPSVENYLIITEVILYKRNFKVNLDGEVFQIKYAGHPRISTLFNVYI